MRFQARLSWVIAYALLAACSADLAVPPGTVINCDDGKCPKGYFCQASSQVCISDSGREGNEPPVITAFSVDDDTVRGVSVLRFTVSDSGAELVRVARLELSGDAAFTTPVEVELASGPGTSFPSGALAELVSSRAGETHSVTWDSRVAAPYSIGGAYLRLTVADVFDAESAPAVVGPFAIGNQSAPRAEILYVKSDGQASAGVVPIAYRLLDEESDIVDVHVDFSTDGRTWQACTEYPTARSEGRHDLATASVLDGGIAHAFYWDSVADLQPYGDARLRIVAADIDQGEAVVLESVLQAGFPGDPRHFLTSFALDNDGNTCEWKFADFDGDGVADPSGSCMYPGIFATRTAIVGSSITFPYRSPIDGNKGPTAIADLDDDGDLDIAFTSFAFGTHEVGFSYNDGTGNFASPVTANLSGTVARIAAGDFDGDGLVEAVVLDGSQARIAQTRAGAGFTITPTSVVGEPIGAVRIAARDYLVVRDGGMKLLAADPGNATFSLIESFGVLPCVGLPIAVDIDDSGAPDMVCPTDTGVVMWLDPSVRVAPPVKVAGGRYVELAAGSLNADQLIDLAAITANRRAAVPLVARRIGEGARDFVAGAPLYLDRPDIALTGLVLTDLNQDRVEEMMVGAAEGMAIYGLHEPAKIGDMPGPARFVAGLTGTPNAVAATDVDRDGVIDLVVAHGSLRDPGEGGGIELLRMATAAGVPIARADDQVLVPVANGLIGLAVGDFDGDGIVDAAGVATERNAVMVFFGGPTANGIRFGTPVTLELSSFSAPARVELEAPLVACNFDDDPQLELAMITLDDDGQGGGNSDGSIHIVDVGAARTLTHRLARADDFNITSVTCADFNGDGKRDFAFTGDLNPGGIYLQNSGGYNSSGALINGGVLLVTDLAARDGVPDIVFAGTNTTDDKIMLCESTAGPAGVGVGACTRTPVDVMPGGGNTQQDTVHGLAAVDLDGDNSNDLAYTKNPSPSFIIRTGKDLDAVPTAIGEASALAGLLVTDLDADDAPDFVTQQRARQALLIQPMRRPATQWVHAATTAFAPTRLVTPVTPTTDRFGASLFESLAFRRYFGPRDSGLRPGIGAQEEMGDLGVAVRNSGLVNLARGLEPLTDAWRALGGRHLARVPDSLSGTGQRLRIVDRFSDQRRIVRVPLIKGKEPSTVVVVFEAEDWIRATVAVPGADGPWPEGESFLPRDSSTGREIVLPEHDFVLVPPDGDGNLANDTGPSYRIDDANGVVEVIIPGPGSVQAFNVL